MPEDPKTTPATRFNTQRILDLTDRLNAVTGADLDGPDTALSAMRSVADLLGRAADLEGVDPGNLATLVSLLTDKIGEGLDRIEGKITPG